MSADVMDHPVGLRGRGFLRRVSIDGGGSFTARDNGDREAGAACVNAGLLSRDKHIDELFHLTAKGAGYLNRLARCE